MLNIYIRFKNFVLVTFLCGKIRNHLQISLLILSELNKIRNYDDFWGNRF